MKVSVVMGSVSDFDSLKEMLDFFKEMDIEVSLRALSAHRTPGELIEYLTEMENEVEVFIAAAGKAAHLPGVVASKTLKPVIGIPVKASTLDGLDALLSIVQMPKGVPVATVAIDGSLNAGILAAQIIALKDEKTATKLKEYKNKMRLEVLSKEQELLKSKGY
ncbi:5-(carboxyamino)imidazole ribonucleotide mutase [Acetoanaerobium noterae]|uniref:5-(carboxyamino)imidazole ribonucleotide mutase n=1 Tax=Acetoanaerobium noterae TaxID=745369 RepID=UPI00334074C9